MPWDEAAHPRGETGTAAGGQFVAAQESAASSTAPAKKGGKGLAYDPKKGTGPGYGIPGGDPRVKKIQELLTKLGLKDARGKPLVIDGRLGPRTTEAIKAAQRKLGLRPDGAATPDLMRRLSRPRMAKARLARKPARLTRKPARERSTSSPRDSAPAPASRR